MKPSQRPDGLRAIARLLVGAIRGYQFVSRRFPRQCRFYPSCSQYAVEALEHHGTLVGGGLLLGRLCRCHPFHPGGLDPVPHLNSHRRFP